MTQNWYDETNGTIIGGFYTRYEFWCKNKDWGWMDLLAREYFESDEQAIQWAKDNYPEEYQRGIEMRVFDQPGAREMQIINARKGGAR